MRFAPRFFVRGAFMDSRERFYAAINHREPDRVPHIALLYQQLVDGLNAELEGADYRDHYGEDIRLIGVDYPEYQTIKFKDNIFPLPSKKALEKARCEIDSVKERGLVSCNTYIPGIFEHFKAFTDDEFALYHMMAEPKEAKVFIGRIADWLCRLFELYAKTGYDICFNGDDIGTQNSTIMGMHSYREFYKQNHKKLLDSIKSANPEAVAAFHCCGHMHTILPEWIEIGVDMVHSVQPEANDLKYLKSEFGDKIAFWGALGLQSEMYYLSIGQMDEAMRECINTMAPGGGFVAGTSNYVTGEVPLEKIKLMYEAIKKYGIYPSLGTTR